MNTNSQHNFIAMCWLGISIIAGNTLQGSDWVAGTQRCTTPKWAAIRTNIRKSLIAGEGIGVDYYANPEPCYSGATPFSWSSFVDYPNDFQWNNGTSTVAPIGFAN